MAVGLRTTRANNMLDDLITSMGATRAIQLHTADPGAVGTTAVANSGRRQAVTFSAAAGGVKSNSVAITWLNVIGPGTQDYTHWTLWDNLTAGAGSCWASGTMTANAIPVGDDFTIAIGGLDITSPVMA